MKNKIVVALTGILMILTACGTVPEKDLEPVTVQLKWLHQAQFAGFYVAQEKGYYSEENLDVTFLEGGPNIDIAMQVVSGEADFGVYGPENLIVARSNGQPVVAIATIFRQSPLVFVTKANSGIESPQDFIGHSAALSEEAIVQFNAMLHQLDLDPTLIEIKPYEYDHQSFIDDQVDITYGYSTGGTIRLRDQGVGINEIWPSDYGVHLYADTLFSADLFLEENPELALRFLRATLRGWKEAIEHTDEAVTYTLNYAQEADPALQTKMMEASIPLVHTGEGQIGWMQPDIWQDMHDILLQQGIIQSTMDVSQVYTLEFLKTIYNVK